MALLPPLRVAIGGPMGAGKTTLVLELCRNLRDRYQLGVVTDEVGRMEDAQFLTRVDALPPQRIVPHSFEEGQMHESPALDRLTEAFPNLEMIFIESRRAPGAFGPASVDLTIYLMDAAAGDKAPRKGGAGITESDLLVINKVDLARFVGASLDVMEYDARRLRGNGDFVFSNLKAGVGLPQIMAFIERTGLHRFNPYA